MSEQCTNGECDPAWLTHPRHWKAAKLKLKLPERNKALHHTAHGLHATYLGAGAIAGHGLESIACGGLLVLVIINYFLHFDREVG